MGITVLDKGDWYAGF